MFTPSPQATHTLIQQYVHVQARDKTIADKLMPTSNARTPNYPFCRLLLVVKMFGPNLNELTNQN